MARTPKKTPSALNKSVVNIKATPVSASSLTNSKISQVTAMLLRDDGASLANLVEATGWLPHTTRAALTGLRKKGHVIGKTSRDGVTIYNIASAV